MNSSTRVARSWGRVVARVSERTRRSARRLGERRRVRLAIPPATGVVVEPVREGVLEIRLVGAARRNVLGRATIDVIEGTAADPPSDARVLVISADPPDFSAGYDLIEAHHGDASSLIARDDNFAALRASRLPVIVALSGNVIGGGLELALLGDVRLATPDTTFAIPASKIGLVYSPSGVRLVVSAFGESLARAMFLGGVSVSCERALSLGVVTRVVGREQLRDEALKLARDVASWPPVATSGNRRLLDAVVGRHDEDTAALREASFEPNGAMAASIESFVHRRARRAALVPGPNGVDPGPPPTP